jgi:Flp pilus assembly CpaF family ATPase
MTYFSEEDARRAIDEMVKLVAEVYKHHGTGGNLHVILDDDNVEDVFVLDAHNWIDENGAELTQEGLAAERDCLAKLRPLNELQRQEAIDRYHERDAYYAWDVASGIKWF